MMKKYQKITLTALALLFSGCLMTTGTLLANAATADDIAAADFLMEGAGVKIMDENSQSGIRFPIYLSNDTYAEIINEAGDGYDANVQVGALLCPKDLLPVNFDASNALSYVEGSKIKQYDLAVTMWSDSDDKAGYKETYVYLRDFPAASYNRDVLCMAYLSTDSGATYQYVQETRSMSQVAKTAIEAYYNGEADELEGKLDALDGYLLSQTVTFISDEETVGTASVKWGNTLLATDIPTVSKSGYTFVGWTYNGENFDTETTAITRKTTLTATWKKDAAFAVEANVANSSVDGDNYYLTGNWTGGISSVATDISTATWTIEMQASSISANDPARVQLVIGGATKMHILFNSNSQNEVAYPAIAWDKTAVYTFPSGFDMTQKLRFTLGINADADYISILLECEKDGVWQTLANECRFNSGLSVNKVRLIARNMNIEGAMTLEKDVLPTMDSAFVADSNAASGSVVVGNNYVLKGGWSGGISSQEAVTAATWTVEMKASAISASDPARVEFNLGGAKQIHLTFNSVSSNTIKVCGLAWHNTTTAAYAFPNGFDMTQKLRITMNIGYLTGDLTVKLETYADGAWQELTTLVKSGCTFTESTVRMFARNMSVSGKIGIAEKEASFVADSNAASGTVVLGEEYLLKGGWSGGISSQEAVTAATWTVEMKASAISASDPARVEFNLGGAKQIHVTFNSVSSNTIKVPGLAWHNTNTAAYAFPDGLDMTQKLRITMNIGYLTGDLAVKLEAYSNGAWQELTTLVKSGCTFTESTVRMFARNMSVSGTTYLEETEAQFAADSNAASGTSVVGNEYILKGGWSGGISSLTTVSSATWTIEMKASAISASDPARVELKIGGKTPIYVFFNNVDADTSVKFGWSTNIYNFADDFDLTQKLRLTVGIDVVAGSLTVKVEVYSGGTWQELATSTKGGYTFTEATVTMYARNMSVKGTMTLD